MELKSRKRRKGEQLQEVFQDIKRLMALAYPGQVGTMAEIHAIDAFVDSFGDRELRKQVLQRSPATLAEALTWAIHIEAIDESGCPDDREKEKEKEKDRDRRKERAYAHQAAGDAASTESVTSEELRQLRMSLQEYQGELARWKAFMAGPDMTQQAKGAVVSPPVSTVVPDFRTPWEASQTF